MQRKETTMQRRRHRAHLSVNVTTNGENFFVLEVANSFRRGPFFPLKFQPRKKDCFHNRSVKCKRGPFGGVFKLLRSIDGLFVDREPNVVMFVSPQKHTVTREGHEVRERLSIGEHQ